MTTFQTIRAAFDEAFTKAAGYGNVDPVELGLKAAVKAMRDELADAIALHTSPIDHEDALAWFNDILGASEDQAAGGPTSNEGRTLEQAVHPQPSGHDAPAADLSAKIDQLVEASNAYTESLNSLAEKHPEALDFILHLRAQCRFSAMTFGPGERLAGVSDHIRKELLEVAKAEPGPERQEEWIDVVMLALDGAWRSGMAPEIIILGLKRKLAKNMERTWPDWRTVDRDKAIEHDRTKP